MALSDDTRVETFPQSFGCLNKGALPVSAVLLAELVPIIAGTFGICDMGFAAWTSCLVKMPSIGARGCVEAGY
jgi:hypothetical protein